MDASHVVVRRFPGPGGHYLQPGEHVRAIDWRNVDTLESQRYIRPLLASDASERAAPQGDGRRRKGA